MAHALSWRNSECESNSRRSEIRLLLESTSLLSLHTTFNLLRVFFVTVVDYVVTIVPQFHINYDCFLAASSLAWLEIPEAALDTSTCCCHNPELVTTDTAVTYCRDTRLNIQFIYVNWSSLQRNKTPPPKHQPCRQPCMVVACLMWHHAACRPLACMATEPPAWDAAHAAAPSHARHPHGAPWGLRQPRSQEPHAHHMVLQPQPAGITGLSALQPRL